MNGRDLAGSACQQLRARKWFVSTWQVAAGLRAVVADSGVHEVKIQLLLLAPQRYLQNFHLPEEHL